MGNDVFTNISAEGSKNSLILFLHDQLAVRFGTVLLKILFFHLILELRIQDLSILSIFVLKIV